MTKPYVTMQKNGAFRVTVPLDGHALPHVLPQEFNTKQEAERWLEGAECQGLVQKVMARHALSEAR
jgi:hypothetical protein